MTHLIYSGKSDAEQRAVLISIVRNCPKLMQAFRAARALNLPEWWIVSGAIYNQVFNHLTGRPDMYGVNDIDLFYFDPDTSYEAEDAVINHAAESFTGSPPVEIRNQARVHLWYEDHFGEAYTALTSSCEAVDRFACRTHGVALRLRQDDEFDLYAPFGLDDIFSFRITPNLGRNNRETHETKAARQVVVWPELTVVPWPN